MEDNAENMAMVAQALEDTFTNPLGAMELLNSWDSTPGFPIVLLRLVSDSGISETVAQSGSIYFKNFIMQYWVPDDEKENYITDEDRNTIKEHILDLMLTASKRVQSQLAQALAIISTSDFPRQWDNLLPGLVQTFQESEDFHVINGALDTAHSIFIRYRYTAKSQELWEEIKYVLDNLQAPLLVLFQKLCGAIESVDANGQLDLMQSLLVIIEVFHSLSAQDIPEFFEDNLEHWMSPFLDFLTYQNADLESKDPSEAGPLDKVKTAICQVVNLYTNKYSDQFADWVPKFVETIWNALSALSDEGKYDQLVTAAIRVLTSVVKKPWHKDLFSDMDTLKTVCSNIVVPQLRLREIDVELFEINGVEYVRSDMEGSDIDTRRRTTVDLVRGLCTHFEEQVTEILKEDVGNLLARYEANPAQNWVDKDAAMYIILALTVQGATKSKGATKISSFVDIMDFFESAVIPELKSSNVSDLPVLKADCIKFCSVFRSQLPPEAYQQVIPILSEYLKSEHFVVHTYAAITIERMLAVKDNKVYRFGPSDIAPMIEELLTNLFAVLEHEESLENEYAMKCIMRVCSVAKDQMAPLLGILDQLTDILSRVSKNPRNPQFNHYLFETVSCLVNSVCKADPNAITGFEEHLFEPFQIMLGMETCQEFGPYVFQILAQLLELRDKTSEAYDGIFDALLSPAIWENKGNVPALVRLLQAYMLKGQHLIGQDKIESLLGVFQKMNASKSLDFYGLQFLCSIVEFIPEEMWGGYLSEVFKLLFQKLQNKPSSKFLAGFCTFLSLFESKKGLQPMLTAMEAVSEGIFEMVLEKIWIPKCTFVSDDIDRKTCIIGMTKLLTTEPVMVERYTNFCAPMLEAIINIFELPVQEHDDDAEEDMLLKSDKGFSTAFARLAFAPEIDYDPHADVKDSRSFLAQSLGQLNTEFPGGISDMVGSMQDKHQGALFEYLQNYGVNIG